MVLIVMVIMLIIMLRKINMVIKMMLIGVVMMKEVIMLIVMFKIVLEMMLMIKMILILKMIMVLKENFFKSILLAFSQLMIRIYHFLIQLDVNNLCSIKMYWVIGLYERNYDLALGHICWFHLYRIFLGNYLSSRFYLFA